MSSAESDTPRSADDLPELSAAQVMIGEAAPDPPPGPVREQMAERAGRRSDHAVSLMERAVDSYIERLTGVVEARMRGPKARKGTRWWADTATKVGASGVTPKENAVSLEVETKALDGSYILPERVITDELADAIRPVGLRIVADAAASVVRGLERPNMGLATYDRGALEQAVDSVVGRMLEVNERHARDVRREILGADATAESLDEAIDRVMEATKRGGRWLLLNGRTLATALAGDAALAAAKALGVTHAQWLSRRDLRVRGTHVVADGQVRAVGEKFDVGGFKLRFPADPFVLPEGAEEVYNCRCGLIFHQPDPARDKAIRLARQGTPAPAQALLETGHERRGATIRTVEPSPERGGRTLSEDTPTLGRSPRVAIEGVPGTIRIVEGVPGLGAPVSVPQVTIPRDVAAYRRLDTGLPVTPGQRISWPGPLPLALAPPAGGGLALVVVLAAGAEVGVSAGAVILPAGTQLDVLAVGADQVVARPVPQ